MEKQTVYVLTEEWAHDGEISANYDGPVKGVYASLEEGKAALEAAKQKFMADYQSGCDMSESDDMSFTAWKDGHMADEFEKLTLVSQPISQSKPAAEETYGCDGLSTNCLGEIPFSEVDWFTGSIGFCVHCSGRLHRHPQKILDFCYEQCEGGDNEIANFVIGLTR